MTQPCNQAYLDEAAAAAIADRCRNPHLFVVGCLRSGTTLLQRMLDSHSLLAVGYDCHFIPQALRGMPPDGDPALTPALIDRVRQEPRFARLGLPDTAPDEAARTARTYSEFVSAIYTAFGRLHGKPLAGEKAPGYCRHLPLLHTLFPWARVLHLYRDGRDIALSVLDWGKGPAKLELAAEEPVAAAALWWRRDVLVGRRHGAALSGMYREVCYESLVGDPRATLQGVASFLDLPFDEAMLGFHEGKTRYKPGRSAKASWLPPTQGLRDWRQQMSARDVELFEALAGDVLGALGYELAAGRISRPVEMTAQRCRRWWAENMSETDGGSRRLERRAAAVERRAQRRQGRRARSGPSPVKSSDPAGAGANPCVFIVGCPRSGTTLLKRMVNAHPQIAITPETHWVPRYYKKRIGVTRDGLVTPDLIPSLLAYYKFPNLKIDAAELEQLLPVGAAVSYSAFVSGVFDLYGRHQGKPFAGDKTPGYVQDIALLHELWPSAKFVHLIRDGRDVCLSMLDWDRAYRTAGRFRTWADDPVSTTAFWWERFVRLGREAGAPLGPALYHEVHYESLVADPAQESASLCAFLGVEPSEAMIKFHEGRTKADPDLSAKKAWRPVTAGMRDWRQQMSPEDLERFEAAAGELLEELGYERAVGCPPSPALAYAERMREQFMQDPRLQRRNLPRRWRAAQP